MAFAASEVEDGTGLETALVYEQPSAAETWLTHAARGKTAFSGLATDALKDKSLYAATHFAEDLIRHLVDGVPLTKKQALVFPRVGCTSRAGRIFDSDEVPPDYLAAIRLFADLDASSPLARVPTGDLAHVESFSNPRGSFKLRDGAQSIGSRYPEPYAYIRRLFDSSRYQETWAA